LYVLWFYLIYIKLIKKKPKAAKLFTKVRGITMGW
jgi:hypothetical protein